MRVGKYNNETITIVEAEQGKFLVIKGNKKSESLIGRPTRMILDNSVEVPEFEEKEIK